MKRYPHTASLISQYILVIFNQTKVPYKKHQLWPLLWGLLEETDHVAGFRICEPVDASLQGMGVPIFIPGYTDVVFEKRQWAFTHTQETFMFKHRPHLHSEDLETLYALPFVLQALDVVREIYFTILKRGTQWTFPTRAFSLPGEENERWSLDKFHQKIISQAEQSKESIFNPLPFEFFFETLATRFPEAFTEGKNPVWEKVYEPVLESSSIIEGNLIRRWEMSRGKTPTFAVAKKVPHPTTEKDAVAA